MVRKIKMEAPRAVDVLEDLCRKMGMTDSFTPLGALLQGYSHSEEFVTLAKAARLAIRNERSDD